MEHEQCLFLNVKCQFLLPPKCLSRTASKRSLALLTGGRFQWIILSSPTTVTSIPLLLSLWRSIMLSILPIDSATDSTCVFRAQRRNKCNKSSITDYSKSYFRSTRNFIVISFFGNSIDWKSLHCCGLELVQNYKQWRAVYRYNLFSGQIWSSSFVISSNLCLNMLYCSMIICSCSFGTFAKPIIVFKNCKSYSCCTKLSCCEVSWSRFKSNSLL